MSKRLEAMSFGGLLDATFRIFGSEFTKVASIAILCNLPVLAMSVIGNVIDLQAMIKANPGAALGLWSLASLVCQLVSTTLMVGAFTFLVSERYLEHSLTVSQVMGRTMSVFGGLLGAQFLVGLWVCLGMLLLLIPGIIWAFTLSLVVPAVVLEGKRGSDALVRSKQLVKYDRGKVVGVVVAMGFIVWALVLGLAGGLGALAGLIIQNADSPIYELIGELIGCIIAPLPSMAVVLLYYDLRIRHEGFDLENLSNEMEAHR